MCLPSQCLGPRENESHPFLGVCHSPDEPVRSPFTMVVRVTPEASPLARFETVIPPRAAKEPAMMVADPGSGGANFSSSKKLDPRSILRLILNIPMATTSMWCTGIIMRGSPVKTLSVNLFLELQSDTQRNLHIFRLHPPILAPPALTVIPSVTLIANPQVQLNHNPLTCVSAISKPPTWSSSKTTLASEDISKTFNETSETFWMTSPISDMNLIQLGMLARNVGALIAMRLIGANGGKLKVTCLAPSEINILWGKQGLNFIWPWNLYWLESLTVLKGEIMHVVVKRFRQCCHVISHYFFIICFDSKYWMCLKFPPKLY